MQWLIEHMSATDDNDTALLKTFADTGRTHLAIKQIPFTETLLGMEQLDPTQPALIYGSTQIVEKVWKQYGGQVETFYDPAWFDPRNWVGKRPDLLNEDVFEITVAELRSKWVDKPTFVKSVTVKALNGMVLEPDKHDWDTWLIEHSELNGSDLLVLSPVHRIEREWRFFVVDGQVVTGSTYRRDGYRAKMHPVSPAAWAAADRAVKEWLPSKNIVIDIARTWSGKYKVVESNAISSSGFYSSNVPKLVDALEAYALSVKA